jgi:hypothetical protein
MSMRNLLALLAALVLTIGGVGWYRGWFTIESTPCPRDGDQDITIHIDKQKIGADLVEGKEKIHDVLEKETRNDSSKRAETTKTAQPNKVIRN